MENISVTHFENDAVQEKKMEGYGWEREEKKNFLASQELTVTITLGEYRELVAKTATAEKDIQASRDRAAKAEVELKKVQEEADRLKAENYDLQNKVLTLQNQSREPETGGDPWPYAEGSADE